MARPATDDPAAVESWFLSRGVPHFIFRYSARRDVFTRVVPALTLVFLFEVAGALNFDWAWWANVLAAAGGLMLLVAAWALANRLRDRPALARPVDVGHYDLAVFVLGPALLPLLFGGQVPSAIATAVVNLMVLGAVYLLASYGIVPMTRWALGRMRLRVADVLGLVARALPLLLLFITFLFINAEVWQVSAELDGLALGLVAALFFVVGTAFLLSRVPREIDALAPDPPLSRRELGNVALVLLFTQGVQVVIVGVTIGAFFVLFGTLAVTEPTILTWTASDHVDALVRFSLSGRELVLTAELLRVATFLAAFTGFYFSVYLVTDETYRREFFDEIVDELREAIEVRAGYLAMVLGREP